MSKKGMKAAIEYGSKLETFGSLAKAQKYYFSYKDIALSKLNSISLENEYFTSDYSVDSLIKLEKWYFNLYENNEFITIGVSQEYFERIMGIYFGEVVVENNADARWSVSKYVFAEGKYELLVDKGLLRVAVIGMFHNLYARTNNKRKKLMYRTYYRFYG